MRLVVDLQACQTGSRNRGIGRYALNLIQAIESELGDEDELVITIDMVDAQHARVLRKELRVRNVVAKVVAYGYPARPHTDRSPAARRLAGQLRSRFYASLNPDALLISSLFETGELYCTELDWKVLENIRTAVIGYDLIPLLFPYRYLLVGGFPIDWYRSRLDDLLKFDLILSISEATKRDLMARLAIDEHRISIIGAGFDATLKCNLTAADAWRRLRELGIRKPFVLMVGNGDWRKNTLGTLRAFSDLPLPLRDVHQLVLTQAGNDVKQALQTDCASLRDQVVILGMVDDATLALLYRECMVFYFPSHYEGFGLPVLEAMALNAPVISSNAGALPEVVHDARILFDPASQHDGVALLGRALSDTKFRNEVRQGACQHALRFSWRNSARRALEALRALCRSSVCPIRPHRTAAWPNERDIALMADALQEVGGSGEYALARGLRAIERSGKRRVLIDVTELIRLDARTGIHRVTWRFLKGLTVIGDESGAFEVEPFQCTKRGTVYAREFVRSRMGVPRFGPDVPVEVQPSDLVFMLDATWESPERFDELHTRARANGGEVVWMIYDLVPIRLPETCNPIVPPVFGAWLRHAVTSADGFVCISQATRSDLEEFMDSVGDVGTGRPWTRTVHLGSDLDSSIDRRPSEQVEALRRLIGDRSFFTALGTLEPRKDYATILDAFESVWARGLDVTLVIIGKRGWNVDGLASRIEAHPERDRRLFWLRDTSDSDVRFLLQQSTALIQASIAEGFGLPLIEAANLGTPLIVSDIPVFHEVAGDGANYFHVGDAEALANVVTATLDGTAIRRSTAVRAQSWHEASVELAQALCVT